MSKYLTRTDAAAELSELFGQLVTKATLEKLAERGDGPPYVILLGRASYPRDDLHRWAEDAPRPPRARALREKPSRRVSGEPTASAAA